MNRLVIAARRGSNHFGSSGKCLRGDIVLMILCCLLLVIVAGCASEKEEKLTFGGNAPDFTATAIGGEPVSLSAMKGRPVILRFFVPNCKYCRADTKIFNQYYQRYSAKGLHIIYINTDPNREEAEKFKADLGIVFPVVLDQKRHLADRYRVQVVPQTIVLDPDHTIIGAILGGVSEAELDDLLLKFIQ